MSVKSLRPHPVVKSLSPHVYLAADLSTDLALTAQWRKNWLITFTASKTKQVTFHHHRKDTEFSRIAMNRCSLRETPHLERLLRLKINPGLK